jgi:diadenosine tetraphosphate (Ap4A) HIT family hydrolase
MKQFPLIFETDHWKVIIHEDQHQLGRAIVTAQDRNRPNLSALTDEEWIDLSHNVIRPYEKAVKGAFGADMFNWSCLMNLAYQNNPPDPHVHWHARPRYSKPVEFAGMTFVDDEFGKHYDRNKKRPLEEDVLLKIVEEIKKYL